MGWTEAASSDKTRLFSPLSIGFPRHVSLSAGREEYSAAQRNLQPYIPAYF